MAEPPSDPSAELRDLRLERDLLRGLLELADREDPRPFLEEALQLIVQVTGARRGYLELEGGRFQIGAGLEESEVAEVRRQLSGGIIAQAIATGRTISTASALDDLRFAAQRSVQAAQIRAVLCAPISGVTPLGVVYLQGRGLPGPFPEEDRVRVELFARHLGRLAERLLAHSEATALRDHTAELRGRLAVEGLAGSSRALAEVFRQVLVAAPVPISVLIRGESGTGKSLLARALHRSSPRASGPFVEVNCAALPEALFESELFGAEKGAHSTAMQRMEGKVEAARGGTLFLDEVGEMPPAAQGKLLTFLQSRRYYRLGGSVPVEADVRVVAASNRDLEELVAERRFRGDLYYRLNVLEVRVPPLRDRPEDIGPIADAVVEGLGARQGTLIPLSRAGRLALREAEWPGNVRQLENLITRGWATALSEQALAIEPRHLFPDRPAGAGSVPPCASFQEATRHFQRGLIEETLEGCGWNVSQAARSLDLSRSRLNELIRAHGLVRASRVPSGS